jgi:hypothetical protein
MLRLCKLFLTFAFCCLSLCANEHFVQSEHLSDALQYVDKNTLVLIDLDNTLVRTKQLLGSDEWFGYSIQKYEKEGYSSEMAREMVVDHWMQIQHKTDMQFLTPQTEKVLKDILQKKSVSVVALTKRPPRLASRTIHQLSALNVNFSECCNYKDCHFFGNQLEKGIIFIAEENDKNKGAAVQEFLSTIDSKPKKILLIDDKENHIRSVGKVLKDSAIEFIGFHYTKANEMIAKFDPQVAEVQLKKFMELLSDEEALLLLSPVR